MKLYWLWHSEFFLEMKNKKWEEKRILSDSWLSNYVFWDFMQRYPKLEIDFAKLDKIDWIFLSHAHCDHFDPYTLIEIYKHQNPDILLPETLLHLQDILEKYLPTAKIIILKDREFINWQNLEFYWIVLRHTSSTNEDDVMTLAVSNDKEICYIEVDTALPETEDIYEELNKIFTRKDFSSICHLATRNELWWIFWSLDAKNFEERRENVKKYIETRMEETEWQYAKYDEWYEDYADLSRLKNYCKLFNGQWIAYPEFLWTEFDEVLIPFTLSEITDVERKTAKNYWRKIDMDFLWWWDKILIENWKILKNTKKISKKTSNEIKNSWIKIIANRDFSYKKNSKKFRKIISQPLFDNKKFLEDSENKKKFLEKLKYFLNTRFLSYQIWSIENPLRELVLRSKNKKYIISIKFENWEKIEKIYFAYSFKSMKFVEFTQDLWKDEYNEQYWASDLHDLFEWKQEMFSTFLHKLEKWKPLFFWTCLWMPFMASDIVRKKFEMHFEKAKSWRSVDEFCEWVLKKFK